MRRIGDVGGVLEDEVDAVMTRTWWWNPARMGDISPGVRVRTGFSGMRVRRRRRREEKNGDDERAEGLEKMSGKKNPREGGDGRGAARNAGAKPWPYMKPTTGTDPTTRE